jgi:hypothetical protein
VLKRLDESLTNVDELNYLAKRLESFDNYEIAKFRALLSVKGFPI